MQSLRTRVKINFVRNFILLYFAALFLNKDILRLIGGKATSFQTFTESVLSLVASYSPN